MIWKCFGFVTLIVITIGGPSARCQVPSLPFEQTIKEILDVGGAIAKAYRNRTDQVQADSVGKLVIDLSTLSGMELSLASVIEQLPGGGAPVVFPLNQMLSKIKDQYQIIQNDLIAIDKKWALKNAMLGIDIGNFAHDGALYYCIVACVGQYYTGGPAIMLKPQEALVLASQMRVDVANIQKLAKDLQEAGQN